MAGLILGADVMAVRHSDEGKRVRAAAASTAASHWLVARAGEDQAARLLSFSGGPIDEDGRIRCPPR